MLLHIIHHDLSFFKYKFSHLPHFLAFSANILQECRLHPSFLSALTQYYVKVHKYVNPVLYTFTQLLVKNAPYCWTNSFFHPFQILLHKIPESGKTLFRKRIPCLRQAQPFPVKGGFVPYRKERCFSSEASQQQPKHERRGNHARLQL